MAYNDKVSAEIVEQYEASSKWLRDNYFSEWAECYRSIRCRVELRRNKKGEEIKNRTNVALPDHFVMRRKKVARLTAQPPNLRVRAATPELRDKVSATMYRQWDLGGWQKVLRQMVDQCGAFGWSVSKTSWNDVVVMRKLRRATAQLNRPQLMMLQGAPADEILDAEEQPDLSDVEIAEALQQFGPEVSMRLPIHKYEGPIGERIFIGDFFPEPGFRNLHQSAWVIEYSERDLAWLDYWEKQVGTNPDTGEEGLIFDPKCVEELKKNIGSAIPRREIDLRRQMQEAIRQTDPATLYDTRLKGPRFPIYERHSIMRDGRIRIDWCHNKNGHLGSMLYPWDTYGKYVYNELVLIPDLLGGVGESNIRASRFLYQLRNTNRNLTTDFLARLLRPKVKRLDTCVVKEEDLERDAFSEVVVSEMGGMEPFVDPRFPSEAFLESQILTREMMQVEPLINDFSPGTDAIPQSGKLATTAIFQQRSADSVINDELKQLDLWLYDVENLSLAMTQQTMQKKVDVAYGQHQRVDALSIMGGGSVRSIQIDPLELQHDMEIFPETGSTLAADDEFKKASIMQGFVIASQHPDIFNKRAFAQKLVESIPGMSVEEALVPDVPKEQIPEVKVNVSVNFKDLPPDAQGWMLSKIGAPTAGTQARGTLESVVKLGEAGEAAANLESSKNEEPKVRGVE